MPDAIHAIMNEVMRPRQKEPKCSVCGTKCMWVEDAWVCTRKSCGSEWYPDHGPEYAPPWEPR